MKKFKTHDILYVIVGGIFMAKRGRPSNKTIRKRKVAKSKSELSLLLAVFVVVALLVAGYFMLFVAGK